VAGGLIELPFPPGTLSGHHNAHWRKLQPIKKKHREWAYVAALAVRDQIRDPSEIPDSDIIVSVTFFPPDRRGDRTNYPNRMKPYFDGMRPDAPLIPTASYPYTLEQRELHAEQHIIVMPASVSSRWSKPTQRVSRRPTESRISCRTSKP
jgi:hypothetical protein